MIQDLTSADPIRALCAHYTNAWVISYPLFWIYTYFKYGVSIDWCRILVAVLDELDKGLIVFAIGEREYDFGNLTVNGVSITSSQTSFDCELLFDVAKKLTLKKNTLHSTGGPMPDDVTKMGFLIVSDPKKQVNDFTEYDSCLQGAVDFVRSCQQEYREKFMRIEKQGESAVEIPIYYIPQSASQIEKSSQTSYFGWRSGITAWFKSFFSVESASIRDNKALRVVESYDYLTNRREEFERNQANASPHIFEKPVFVAWLESKETEFTMQYYRPLSTALHPDKFGGDGRLMQQLATLKDSIRQLSGDRCDFKFWFEKELGFNETANDLLYWRRILSQEQERTQKAMETIQQQRERAEQERERAKHERERAERERERAEQERERAEQERERAEQERERAEQERERAEWQRERIRELEQERIFLEKEIRDRQASEASQVKEASNQTFSSPENQSSSIVEDSILKEQLVQQEEKGDHSRWRTIQGLFKFSFFSSGSSQTEHFLPKESHHASSSDCN